MTDLVRRLREGYMSTVPLDVVCKEAANRIEELEMLLNASKVAAKACADCDPHIGERVRELERENAALKEKLAVAEDAWHMANGTADLAMKHRDAAEAENAALRTDAERYRWLRGNVFVDVIEDDGRYWTVRLGDEKELDTAIDAARKERP